MQQQSEINGHKRPQPMSSATGVELQPSAPKKRRTIEDALRAAGLEPGTTTAPTSTSTISAAKPANAPTPVYAQPYQTYPTGVQNYSATNGYTNYQFNNYISQTTYPLIGTDPNLARQQYAPSLYQTIQQTSVGGNIYGMQPPPPPTAPPKAPVQQPMVQSAAQPAKRKSPWEKAPVEKSATLLKAINHIATTPKIEMPKQDILEDKTLPDSVRRFIVRGYAKCYTEAEKEYMRNLLRRLISMSKITGQLYTKKWDEIELPKLPREIQHPALAIPSKPSSGNVIAVSNVNGVPGTTTSVLKIENKPITPEEIQKRNERKNRFASTLKSEPSTFTTSLTLESTKNVTRVDEDPTALDYGIKGTCTKLEKEYFRLSAAPDPSTVRPEEVLVKSLKMIKQKWRSKTADYAYVCDQLRSIRQDMMVQRIKDEFAVEVYETHARIALECRDIAHFNQCQTQLDELYEMGIKGHKEEFLGYRILYAGLHNMQIELTQILKKLTLKDKQNGAIKHALKVVRALGENNYTVLFKEYKRAPNMSGYLLDLFIERLRVFALQTMAVTYAMGLELEFVAEQLALNSVEKCKEFIVAAGGKVNETTKKLDCKGSVSGFRASPILTKKIT